MPIIAFIYLAIVVTVLAIGVELEDIKKYAPYESAPQTISIVDVLFNIFGYGFGLSIFSIIPFVFGYQVYKKYINF